MLAVRALVTRIKDDAMKNGAVDVPRSLTALRREAAEHGYATDTQGMRHV